MDSDSGSNTRKGKAPTGGDRWGPPVGGRKEKERGGRPGWAERGNGPAVGVGGFWAGKKKRIGRRRWPAGLKRIGDKEIGFPFLKKIQTLSI